MNAEDRCFCELAPLYALNLLDETDRRWVEEQITVNPELAVELAEYQITANTLPYSAPPVPMAADLKERLFQRLAQEPATQEPATDAAAAIPFPDAIALPNLPQAVSSAPQPTTSEQQDIPQNRVVPLRRRNTVWLQTAGVVAAVAAIALLVDNYRLRQTTQADRAIVATLQQPSSLVYTLKGTEKASSASGSLLVNSNEKAAVVLVQNLPELPAGQAYRLWAVAKGATKPTYCGQFNKTQAGTVRWALPEAACGANIAQMLITAESASAPPVPAGPLVMKSAS